MLYDSDAKVYEDCNVQKVCAPVNEEGDLMVIPMWHQARQCGGATKPCLPDWAYYNIDYYNQANLLLQECNQDYNLQECEWAGCTDSDKVMSYKGYEYKTIDDIPHGNELRDDAQKKTTQV